MLDSLHTVAGVGVAERGQRRPVCGAAGALPRPRGLHGAAASAHRLVERAGAPHLERPARHNDDAAAQRQRTWAATGHRTQQQAARLTFRTQVRSVTIKHGQTLIEPNLSIEIIILMVSYLILDENPVITLDFFDS